MAGDDFMLEMIPTDFNVELIWNDGPDVLLPSNLESPRTRVSLPFPPEDSIP